MPADNGRFGVMAAVAPQKQQCRFETLYPAGSVVEAATTPSRRDVTCKRQKYSEKDKQTKTPKQYKKRWKKRRQK